MKLRPISTAVLLMMSALASTVHADEARRSYIVQLVDKPAATYTGQVAGLAATMPAQGQRLNVDAADVQAYISYLETKQNDVISTVTGAEITNKYDVVFNGFSALLTDDEVRALKKHSGVAAITADNILQLDTSYTPSFLGLDKAGGLWEQLGGKGSSGEDIIIGIVDGGIWPENNSYADREDDAGNPSHTGSKLVYGAPPASWKGNCDSGEGFSVANCNNKLIGARYYKPATQALHWTEFNSARDSVGGTEGEGGHGSHTSSTAGGNNGVPVSINGVNMGKISGIAPRARIAAYKVCWTDGATGKNGCSTASSVAAINQAVKDGVNVINYSIGPNAGGGSFSEAGEQAFLGAAAAGVFVAASGGNSGPTATAPAPVSHISPWLTTVGNSTHDRIYVGDAILGNGVTVTGASSNANTPAAPLILAKDAGLAGANAVQLARCFGGTDGMAALLDPAKVNGKVLVCDRGDNVLVNKSANAKTAGAVGVIIANVEGGAATIINQGHVLSTVHITKEEGKKVKDYVAAAPASANSALGNVHATFDPTVKAPIMNGSSSRGPNVANASILKPDLTAPGTDILAAITADLTREQRDALAVSGASPVAEWGFKTGTSMASPHVAGIAALLKQRHPDWTPAAIKSALMTTAFDTFTDGLTTGVAWDATAKNTGTLPWGQGAGHVAPTSAADPGLVYDIAPVEYARFLCGQGLIYTPAQCVSYGGAIAAQNLNLASLTISNVLGSATITRTVTNVGASAATYNASATMPGYAVLVTPSQLVLAPGQKASFTVKVTRTDAPVDTWVYGKLVWSDGVHTVRSPLTLRGSALAAPAGVYSEATTGSKVVTLGTGFAGAMSAAKGGLIPASQESRTVVQGTNLSTANAQCAAGGAAGVNVHTVSIPAGTIAARFSLYDAETTGNGGDDLDLVVARGTTIVASSGNATSNESVQLLNPAAGEYKVCVVGYAPVGGASTYKLSSWLVQPTSTGGNFKVNLPSSATVGGTASVGLSWSGLPVGKRYVGAVNFLLGGVRQGTTVVDVDTTDPLPLFQNARTKEALAF
ncbi:MULTISPECIES: S8 family serine peptidase [unclassified Duganella]|uniref:S8 family serine peptidase n=1 Tax=unclassified Duganella TaxID=2636909 RepID=UPI00088066AA|nr:MULTISPECIES: S8 family serine peptidase [unclassified Duganella]SDH14717.1 Peptidase inhibitor I9 [Duganella sp. OV458]SDK29252.1 Peptidase inhibitor I9 [Duganella sp. OV510]